MVTMRASRRQARYGPYHPTFTGTVNWVQIDLGEDAEDADHLITPEERLRVAMARQADGEGRSKQRTNGAFCETGGVTPAIRNT